MMVDNVFKLVILVVDCEKVINTLNFSPSYYIEIDKYSVASNNIVFLFIAGCSKVT